MNAGYASTIDGVGRAVDQRRVGQLAARRSAARTPRRPSGPARRRSASFQRARSMPSRDRRRTACCSRAPTTVTSKPFDSRYARCCCSCRSSGAADVADADRSPARARLRVSKNAWWIAFSARTCCDGVDDARDVALRRALRDRADVDVAAGRASRTPSRPRRAGPSSPRRRRRGSPGRRLTSTVHQLLVELEPELLLGSPRPPRAASALRTREADRVLGRGLRDQDDVDAPRRQRAEHAARRRRARRPCPDRAASAATRSPTDVMPFASCPVVRAPCGRSACPARRVERVLDQNRNALRDRRRDRRRVQHLGAELRQLHRLFVGHLRQHERRRHDAADRRSARRRRRSRSR